MQLHDFVDSIQENDADFYTWGYRFTVIHRKGCDVFLARKSNVNTCLFCDGDVWGYIDTNRHGRAIVGTGATINSAVIDWLSKHNDSVRAYQKAHPFAGH